MGKGAKDVKKEKDIKEREMVEKVLRALDSDRTESRLSLKEVERIVRDLGLVPGDDPKAIAALAREALNEVRNRIREALEGLRESLNISSPLPPGSPRSWRGGIPWYWRLPTTYQGTCR